MGILTDDMKCVVREQKLGFIATVCPDGTPNLSPKGTTEAPSVCSRPRTLAGSRHHAGGSIGAAPKPR